MTECERRRDQSEEGDLGPWGQGMGRKIWVACKIHTGAVVGDGRGTGR